MAALWSILGSWESSNASEVMESLPVASVSSRPGLYWAPVLMIMGAAKFCPSISQLSFNLGLFISRLAKSWTTWCAFKRASALGRRLDCRALRSLPNQITTWSRETKPEHRGDGKLLSSVAATPYFVLPYINVVWKFQRVCGIAYFVVSRQRKMYFPSQKCHHSSSGQALFQILVFNP